jgi:hypothetical protein
MAGYHSVAELLSFKFFGLLLASLHVTDRSYHGIFIQILCH